MAKRKCDENDFIKRISLVGDGPGIAFLRSSFGENEKGESPEVEDDEDTSHLSDMRHHKSSSHPLVRKKKHPYSFVR